MYATILPYVLVAYYLFFLVFSFYILSLSLSFSVIQILSFCIFLTFPHAYTHIFYSSSHLTSVSCVLSHAHTNRHATRTRTHTLGRIQTRITRTRTADGRNGGYKASLKTAFLSVNVKVCTTYEALAP